MAFMFDIETLSVESTAVILSYAIVHFDPNDKPTYQQLLDNTLFIKIDAKSQVTDLKRTVSKEVMEWWDKQPAHAKKVSLIPDPIIDVSPLSAYNILQAYVNKYPNINNQTFWARGSMDQVCIESFCKSLDKEPVSSYNNWRDVRTAVDLLYGSTNGYCDIDHPEFSRDMVIKHTPYHDVCLDVMMLIYGKEKV
ncbi:exonuclease [uncultured Caudovirales phage]|uniref:Exonuclease n=1 Tax=uncultured Caudovirales phage TaxID=2100421 RepID=A0A6J5L1X4_9CAUD|nr:exonuclease [uncultured Caudovirales phage]